MISPMNNANTPTPAQAAPKKKLVLSKIYVDRDLCIGAAPCVTIAPGVFQLDEENKAYIVDANAADAETILLAAQSCPVQAIILHDAEGNQIYP
jgi:ferredoxin